MLTVVTASTDQQYTTTAAVKAYIGSTYSTDDAQIDLLITRASRWVDTYISRGPLSVQSYREALSGYGNTRMMLSRRPVRAVTGFWDSTSTGSATTMLSTEYRLDEAAGIVARDEGFYWDAPGVFRPHGLQLAEAYWPGEEEPGWLMDYVAGYTYGGISTGSDNWSTEKGSTSTGRTLPEDIEYAVIQRAAEMYEGTEGLVEVAVDDLRERYGSFGSGETKDPAAQLLEPYRAVV